MKITEVKIHRLVGEGKTLGFAAITIDDCFIVRNLRIMSGQNGLFVAMPSRKLADGDFINIVHPITTEAKEMIQKQVLEEYGKTA